MSKKLLMKLLAHWFLLSIAVATFVLITPFYLKNIGYSEVTIGQIFFFGSILSAFLITFFAIVSDVLGRKFYLFTFCLMFVISSVILYSKPVDFLMLVLFGMLFGSVDGSRWVFAKIFTIESYDHKKGVAFGILTISLIGGFIIGTLAGGYMWDHFGLEKTCLISILISGLSLIPVFSMEESIKEKTSIKGLRDIKLSKKFLSLLIYRFFSSVSYSMIMAFAMPLYFGTRFSMSTEKVGRIIMLANSGMMIGSLAAGNFVDRHDYKVVNFLSFLFIAASFGFMYFFRSLNMTIVCLIMGFMGYGVMILTLPYFFREVSNSSHGRDIGIIDNFGGGMGGALGSLISGSIIHFFGYVTLFPVFSLTVIMNAIFLFVSFGGIKSFKSKLSK